MKTQRVVFSFDDRSLESLSKMTAQGRGQSGVTHRLLPPTPAGFKEVEVRNPETGETRIIVVPVNL